MDKRLSNMIIVYIFVLIDMSRRCLMLSRYWEVDPAYHWSNTTGGIVYTLIGSNLSKSDCAVVCLYNADCLMFGYSNVQSTDDIRFLSEITSIIAQLCCHLAGYAWMEDGPLCVKIHNNTLNWDTAKTLCEQYHGRLAILDDAKRHQAYFNYGGDGYKDAAWLGVTDQDTEGSWVWINGADLNTSYWSFVQLNDYSGEYLPDKFNADCAATGGYGGIIDLHCLQTMPFICQRIDLE